MREQQRPATPHKVTMLNGKRITWIRGLSAGEPDQELNPPGDLVPDKPEQEPADG